MKDLSDYFDAGFSAQDLLTVIEATAPLAVSEGDAGNREVTASFTTGDIKELGLERVLAEELREEGEHFAKDSGGKLFRYNLGAYRDRAELFVARAVKRILEESGLSFRWKPSLDEAVCEYIRADAPDLWEVPPAYELNLLNGVLNVVSRELRPHSPEWISSVQLPVSYDPQATCPENDEFLQQVYQADSWTAGVPWELEARYMLPARGNQKADLFLGEGGVGKSTRLERLRRFLGPKNCSALSLHKLETDRFAVAQLQGKLANISPDMPSKDLETTAVFKTITGGDPLTGEYKFRDLFLFYPFCHLAFSANSPPRSADASGAFFDRWHVHTFSNKYRGTSKEISQDVLLQRLSSPAELSGVLNQALDALVRIRKSGLTVTPSMAAALAELRAVTDPLHVWLERHTIVEPAAFVPMAELLAAYNRAASTRGAPVKTSTALGIELARFFPKLQKGQRTISGKQSWCYLGVGLIAPDDNPSSHGSHGSPYMFPTNRGEMLENAVREGGGEKDQENRVNRVKSVSPEPEIDSAPAEQPPGSKDSVIPVEPDHCSLSGCFEPTAAYGPQLEPLCDPHYEIIRRSSVVMTALSMGAKLLAVRPAQAEVTPVIASACSECVETRLAGTGYCEHHLRGHLVFVLDQRRWPQLRLGPHRTIGPGVDAWGPVLREADGDQLQEFLAAIGKAPR